MLAQAEAEDMLRLSSDFCHQSGHIQLISCFEARATSTERGRLLVSKRCSTGTLILPTVTGSAQRKCRNGHAE